jgi:hypothetical protein
VMEDRREAPITIRPILTVHLGMRGRSVEGNCKRNQSLVSRTVRSRVRVLNECRLFGERERSW